MSANTTRMQRASRPLGLGCALIALAFGTGGCTRLDENTAADLHDVTNRHPVSFASSPETLYVEVPSGSQRLSPDQEADVYRFVAHYKAESTGTLRIGAPRSIASHLKSSGVGRQIEAIVHNAGIDARSVETMRTASGGPAGPALSLSYDRTVALAPQCGDWGTSVGENRERLPFNNFGCATQRNFALTVANARDLQQPQDEAQRSSERRSASWSKYIDNKSGGGGGGGAAGAADAAGAPPAAPKE
jgi:pilus assembly protein CpaD